MDSVLSIGQFSKEKAWARIKTTPILCVAVLLMTGWIDARSEDTRMHSFECVELAVKVSPGGRIETARESGRWFVPGHAYVGVELENPGHYVEFKVPIPRSGKYAIQIDNRMEPGYGAYRLVIGENGLGDFEVHGQSFDQGRIFVDADLQEHYPGVFNFEREGTWMFRFELTDPGEGGFDLGLSRIVLHEMPEYSFDEGLQRRWVDGKNALKGFYLEAEAEKPGPMLRRYLEVDETGSYVFAIRNVKGPNRGRVQVYIDGKPYGDVIDQYREERSYSLTYLGVVDMKANDPVEVGFKIIGKDRRSGGYGLGVDFVRLVSPDIVVSSGWGTNAELTRGWWPTSTHADKHFGRFYRFSRPGQTRFYRNLRAAEEPDLLAWKPWGPDFTGFLVSGYYNVYYWLPDGEPDRASNASYTVYHKGGTTTYTVDQRVSGGEWRLLGWHYFEKGRARDSGYVELSNDAEGLVIADSVKFEYSEEQGAPPGASKKAAPESGEYTVRHDKGRQKVWGLGVEIQPEAAIGADRNRYKGIPGDLTDAERARFSQDLLGFGHGFRYLRLPMGLFYTGLCEEQKNFREMWEGQNRELKEMMELSGLEGINFEYWSPPPYFKSEGRFVGGSLKRFDQEFLTEFGHSIVRDLSYVEENIAPIKMFSLQNEPSVGQAGYGCCEYSGSEYYDAFSVVAPIIKKTFPDLVIHADSQSGQYARGSQLIRDDEEALQWVDGWSWHRVGKISDEQIQYADSHFLKGTEGRPVYNVEFEYLQGAGSAWRTVNTAQSIMNWFGFLESPTWFWLHVLKPTTNLLGERYGLGFWRPDRDNDFERYADIKKGHWEYNWFQWNSIAGFLKHMPWDSVIFHVEEEEIRMDNRILAWKTPEGKLVLALTNRSGDTSFVFDIDVGLEADFRGYRYSSETRTNEGVYVGSQKGAEISCELPPFSIEFWVQE